MTDDHFIDFQCPHCHHSVSFPQDYPPLQECPMCSESILFPQAGAAVGRTIPLPIATPRLALRRLNMRDWKDLLEILSDEATFQFADGHPQEEESVLRWLEADAHIRLTTLGESFCLGMELPTTGKLIGYVSLTFKDQARQQAALGIFVNRGYQRQGLATEAIAAVLGFCLGDLKLHRATADCDSRNAAARRVLEKVGMRWEGEFLQSHWVHDEWINTVWHAMLREECGKAAAAPPIA